MSQTNLLPDRQSPPRTPRWVKIFGIVVLLFFLLFVILHVTGYGLRGHGEQAPSIEQNVHQP